MYSDDENDSDSENESPSIKGSGNGSRAYSRDVSPYGKNSNAGISPSKLPGGAPRLNINVGGTTI